MDDYPDTMQNERHAPPYQVRNHDSEEAPNPPYSPYANELNPYDERLSYTEEPPQEDPKPEEKEDTEATDMNKMVMSMLFLLSGAVFLLFGFILLLFAKDGVLTLQWNAKMWPFYLCSSIPLLFLGWRYLKLCRD